MDITGKIQLAISVLTLLAMIFAVYKYFRNPDIKADKEICLLKQELKEHKDMSSELIKTNQNCLHSLEKEVASLKGEVNGVNLEIVRLGTIIEERIPKK